jgi:hypothetical protein
MSACAPAVASAAAAVAAAATDFVQIFFLLLVLIISGFLPSIMEWGNQARPPFGQLSLMNQHTHNHYLDNIL